MQYTELTHNVAACAICGVLCISLPIPIIVNNFNKFYEKAKIEEEILSKKKKSLWRHCYTLRQAAAHEADKACNGIFQVYQQYREIPWFKFSR